MFTCSGFNNGYTVHTAVEAVAAAAAAAAAAATTITTTTTTIRITTTKWIFTT
jgi:hypothetical protein